MKNRWQIITIISLIIAGFFLLYRANQNLKEIDQITLEYWSSAYRLGYAHASRDWHEGIANAGNAQEMSKQRALEGWERIK